MGLKEVLDYLKLVADIWGFEVSQSIGLITPPGMISKKQEQENLQGIQKKRRSPGLKDVLVFRAQKASFGKPGYTGSADYAYWKEKGWLNPEAKYYMDVPVNPVYNAIGWISEQIIRRKMEKEIAELGE